jgi:hypothetical protein
VVVGESKAAAMAACSKIKAAAMLSRRQFFVSGFYDRFFGLGFCTTTFGFRGSWIFYGSFWEVDLGVFRMSCWILLVFLRMLADWVFRVIG